MKIYEDYIKNEILNPHYIKEEILKIIDLIQGYLNLNGIPNVIGGSSFLGTNIEGSDVDIFALAIYPNDIHEFLKDFGFKRSDNNYEESITLHSEKYKIHMVLYDNLSKFENFCKKQTKIRKFLNKHPMIRQYIIEAKKETPDNSKLSGEFLFKYLSDAHTFICTSPHVRREQTKRKKKKTFKPYCV